MKQLSAPMAAALALGVLVAPSAEAGTEPVYDPGSRTGSNFVMVTDHAGTGRARVAGKFLEYSLSLGGQSYVIDAADDGLDVHLWIRYGDTNDNLYKENIATASGLNVSRTVAWASPAGMQVDHFGMRVCVGAGEDNCSTWTA
jgi:hypothetical protein